MILHSFFLPSHSKRETELKQRRENDELTAKVHKAISVIQFKLEGRILRIIPNITCHTVSSGKRWTPRPTVSKSTVIGMTSRIPISPTLSPEDPYRLSPEEETVMNDLAFSFRNSIRMQRHLKFLFG